MRFSRGAAKPLARTQADVQGHPLRVLLIDNHDSFTSNLAHLLHEVCGTMPELVANDAAQWADVAAMAPDAIVLSPGPGRPEHPVDIGLCAAILEHANVPILGVCLGHQAMVHAAGGSVTHAPYPMHGRLSAIRHRGDDIFAGLPDGFGAVRYHSLMAGDLPAELAPLALSDDGVIMALRHRSRPWRGVQFHPESIATEHGARLVGNFFARFGLERRASQRAARSVSAPPPAPPFRVEARRLDRWVDPESAFVALHGTATDAFWLDSSRLGDGRARFSFMGDAKGPRAARATYDLARRRLDIVTRDGVDRREGDCLSLLREIADGHRVAPTGLPFRFALGWVGYLGYEMKAQTEGAAVHPARTPDAAFIFADRAIAYDHRDDAVWLLALTRTDGDAVEHDDWFATTRNALLTAPIPEAPAAPPLGGLDEKADAARGLRYRLGRDDYLAAIAACAEALRDGETYEICLTNRVSLGAPVDPLSTYRALRRLSPAPYAAFLRMPGLAVLSASPERFLAIDGNGDVEARPIKGTRPRHPDPAIDAALARDLRDNEKDRAENLMVVDLLRNDIGRVAAPGSVHVPGLFEVESFAQVHQLVSTIRARLDVGRDAYDCVRAAFPGGSMTGAPKQRTMRLLDGLEGGPRGIYSGALGYFSLDGTADLSIVIRTIVVTDEDAHYGIGGAVVALSDPIAEWRETLVKGRALAAILANARPLRALGGTIPAENVGDPDRGPGPDGREGNGVAWWPGTPDC